MAANNRKQITQMAILAVLIIVMVFSAVNLMKRIRGSSANPPAANTPSVESRNPSATNMAPVPGSAATTDGAAASEATSAATRLNANQFRVFALSPAKSPFVQQERWYEETIKEQIPGYPGLKDSGYFESDSLYLPKLDMILDPTKEWDQVVLRKDEAPQDYSVSGMSKDGQLSTSILLKEKEMGEHSVTWTADSGVPLSELTIPGWQSRYPQLLEEPGKPEGGVPSSADLFGGNTEGLGLPGGGVDQAGDVLSCQGVSLRDGKASALIVMNGRSFITKQGGMLAPAYQVLEVKADGAVLVDTRDGSSRWLPLERSALPSIVDGSTSPGGSGTPATMLPIDPVTGAFRKGLESITDSAKQPIEEMTLGAGVPR
jgi:hypothetical protein